MLVGARGRPDGSIADTKNSQIWIKFQCKSTHGILKGIHNLRHTFGRRLRSAGIPLETRKALLGHADGDITTHYSAAELNELILAAESIVSRGRTETPNLMLIHQRNQKSVGNRKRASEENPLTLLCFLTDSLQIIPDTWFTH